MTTGAPAFSVIIPTHNRRASVTRTLSALGGQTLPPDRFEVIVVADGCSDDTASALRSLTLPYRLQVIEQPGQGQGKARNAGAAAAAAPILVFLDDDIVPHAGLLEGYERSHRAHPRHLHLGPALPVLNEERSLFSHGLRNWWNDHHRALRHPAHRFTYRDMHSGNFSIPAELFAESGGFDPEFFGRSGEDYEFGIRLLAMGVSFVLAPAASADHHDATDLPRSLGRVRMEGRADVLIGLRHPALRAGTGLARFRAPGSRVIRWLRSLAFHHPRIGDGVARAMLACMGPLERLRLRRSWRDLHGAVRSYWYCRGAAEELRASAGNTTLEAFLDVAPAEDEPALDLDLAQGIEAAGLMVDRLRPRGVRVSLAGITIGTLAALPGAEPVRGTHLTEFLAGDRNYQLLVGLSAQRMRRAPEEAEA